MGKDSPMAPLVDYHVKKMVESGVIKKYLDKYFKSYNPGYECGVGEGNDGASPLTLRETNPLIHRNGWDSKFKMYKGFFLGSLFHAKL